MPSLFAKIEDRAALELNRIMGEAWQFRPMTAGPGGGRRTADATRATATVTAVLRTPLARSTEFGSEARGSVPRSIEKPELWMDTRQMPGVVPQRFDRFARTGTGEIYEVADVQRDGEGWLKMPCKLIGSED